MDDDAAAASKAFRRMQEGVLEIVGVDDRAQASAEQRLIARLLEADILQQATVGRSDRANLERYFAIRALHGCIELINENPDLLAARLAAPLVRLQAALEDLDRGVTHPMLRAVKRSRKDTGPRSRIESTLRGQLAGTVEALMRHAGMSEPEAAHHVQRRLSEMTARRVKLTAAQLIEWRKQARGKRTDDFMRTAYHKVQIEDWRDPLGRADSLIEGFLKLA